MARETIANLGEIMQIAFVPQDFDGAIAHWVKLGAGPFYIIRDNQAEWQEAYGVECRPVLDIALGQWGEMQIEVIRQKSDEKTVYSDWFNAASEGVHHTCIAVDDIDETRQRCLDNGLEIVIEGRANGTRWLYADTGGGPGTYLEAIEKQGGSAALTQMLKDAHRNWDGSDPIREIQM
ncbi:MAG: VOC family protein [Sphingomonadaceae bacterium]|nr:VOC family protein [Sphingomonadaceae bacterium]